MIAAKKGPGGWGPHRDKGGVEHPQHVTPTLHRQPEIRDENLRRVRLAIQAMRLIWAELREIRRRLAREVGGRQ